MELPDSQKRFKIGLIV